MRIVGVDPGITGAIALLHDDGLDLADMPALGGEVDGWVLTALFAGWGQVDMVAVEAVHAMPVNGSIGNFKLGRALGVVQGVLAALARPVCYVTPGSWTRHHRVGSDKDVHRRRACELWPDQAHLFARKKDDGRADAALIARWRAESATVDTPATRDSFNVDDLSAAEIVAQLVNRGYERSTARIMAADPNPSTARIIREVLHAS